MRKLVMLAAIALAAAAAGGCRQEPTAASAASDTPAGTQTTAAASSTPPAAGTDSPAGATCGGIAGQVCVRPSDFCRLSDGQCNAPDAQGTCTTPPEVCTEQYDPVCGCDGKTYGNACNASGAGVSVDYAGECKKQG